MLGERHDLHGPVPGVADSWKDVRAKLLVGADLGLRVRHAHVGLVDEQRVRRAPGLTVTPGVGFHGPPNLRVEAAGLLILQHAAGPSGQAIASSAWPANLEPIGIAV